MFGAVFVLLILPLAIILASFLLYRLSGRDTDR
jgi:hypothetical protein